MQLQRSWEQTAVGSDLLKWRYIEGLIQNLAAHIGIKKTKMIEAGVGGVEDTEAVPSRLDLEKRHDLAVDAVHVPVELLNPDGVFFGAVDDLGIVERAVVMEEAILQHERDLELALWKVERLLCFVTNEIETSQTGIDVQPGDAEAVVVVPERGGGLAIRVRGWVRIEFGSVLAVCGEPGFGIPIVVGENTGAVEMGDVADGG